MHKLFVFSCLTACTLGDLLLERQQIESYAPCKIDSDCKPNAFCFGNDDTKTGRCKCQDEFELNRNKTFYECLKGAELGQACEKDFQCKVTAGPMAICDKYSLCDCNEHAHRYRDGQCHKNTNLTDICLSDANCLLKNGDFAFCTNGFCSCPLRQKPTEDLNECVLSREINEDCASDKECPGYAVCAGICKCGAQFTLSRNGSTCLKAATVFGDKCEEDSQCSKFLQYSVCNNAKCDCEEGFHPSTTLCAKGQKVAAQSSPNSGGKKFMTLRLIYFLLFIIFVTNK